MPRRITRHRLIVVAHSQPGPGATDQFGVRQIELYHNADGKVYCLLKGPDKEAIRKHHQALSVPCGDVRQVNSLL
jgi:hypothetical protein